MGNGPLRTVRHSVLQSNSNQIPIYSLYLDTGPLWIPAFVLKGPPCLNKVFPFSFYNINSHYNALSRSMLFIIIILTDILLQEKSDFPPDRYEHNKALEVQSHVVVHL